MNVTFITAIGHEIYKHGMEQQGLRSQLESFHALALKLKASEQLMYVINRSLWFGIGPCSS